MCRVSVIMPAYNSEKYIGEAIDSVLSQTYCDWELIIINDGSKDGTSNVVKKYNDERIVFIDNKENHGFLYSLNYAVSIAKGEYLAKLDDDDVACPHRFEKQVDYLDKNKDILLVGGMSDYLINGKVKKGPRYPMSTPKEITFSLAFGNYCLGHSSLMIRKSLFEKEGITYNTFKQVPDCHIQQDIALHGLIGSVNEVVYKYRIHPAQSTAVRSMEMKNTERDTCFCMYIDKLDVSDDTKYIFKKALCRDLNTEKDFALFEESFIAYAAKMGLGTSPDDLKSNRVYKYIYKSVITAQKNSKISYKSYYNTVFTYHDLKNMLWRVMYWIKCILHINSSYIPAMIDYSISYKGLPIK